MFSITQNFLKSLKLQYLQSRKIYSTNYLTQLQKSFISLILYNLLFFLYLSYQLFNTEVIQSKISLNKIKGFCYLVTIVLSS